MLKSGPPEIVSSRSKELLLSLKEEFVVEDSYSE